MASISMMKKYLPEGTTAILFLENDEEKRGEILEYDNEANAVVIQTDENEYIPCDIILRFKTDRNGNEKTKKITSRTETIAENTPDHDSFEPKEKDEGQQNILEAGPAATDKETPNDEKISSTDSGNASKPSSPMTGGSQDNEKQLRNQQDIRRIALLFSGAPKLDMPPIDFNCSKIKDKELLSAISRQKSVFEYAVKIKEYSRINNLIPSLVELTKSYPQKSAQWGYVNYLAGMFAHAAGHSPSEVSAFLSSALESMYECNIELACVELQSDNFEGAINHLIEKIIITQDCEQKEDYVRTLGQCIMKVDGNTHPVIGKILNCDNITENTKDMIWELILFLVKDDEDAIVATKKRDIDALRKTKTGNNLFPWQEDSQKSYLEEINDPIPQKKEDPNQTNVDRRGRISAYYPAKKMGFLIESGSGQTWFFHASVIYDDNLLNSLTEGNVGHEVLFYGDNSIITGKYPAADKVLLVSAEGTVDARTPLSIRLKGLPKNSTNYAKAKEAEQLDQLDEARRFYLKEIEAGANSRYFKSAVKDLATLLNREGKPDEAIVLLDKYKSFFASSEQISLSQMKVQFYIKAKKYSQAADILVFLAQRLPLYDSRRAAYFQQEAYCYYAMGDYDTAIAKLKQLKRQYPKNEIIASLLDKIEYAKEHGDNTDVVSGEEHDVEIMFENKLSILTEQKLLNCDYEGVDVRSREDENFTTEDIGRVETLKNKVFGKRPVESSKYLLTLAKLTQRLAMPYGETNRYLLDYYICMAEAAAYDDPGTPREVVNCYAAEALQLAQPSSKNIEKIKKAWTLFLAAYNTREMPIPKELLQDYDHTTLRKECSLLFNNTETWKKVIADLPLFSIKFKRCFSILLEALQPLTQIELPREVEYIVSQTEKNFALFSNLETLNLGQINQIREKFLQTDLSDLYDLDQERIRNLINILHQCCKMLTESVFLQIENLYLQIHDNIKKGMEEILREPSTLTIDNLFPVLKQLQKLLVENFGQLCKQEPKLEVTNLVPFYPPSNTIPVKLQIKFCTKNAPPIDRLSICIKGSQQKFEDCLLPEVLGYGTTECEFRFSPTDSDLAEKIISLDLFITYHTRNGEEKEDGPFPVSVRLGDPMTEDIDNPYLYYSGGKSIEADDYTMFFGRQDLIERIVQQLSEPYKGSCFVLYGQKRSGKTSVVYKIAKQLPPNTIYSYVSAGSFNERSQYALDAMCVELYADVKKQLETDYNLHMDFDISDPMLTSRLKLNKIKEFLLEHNLSWVIAVDEFTHIYANDPEDTKKFMHAWKTFLEQKIFNAIIIGQDTMPQFKRAYSNDFCVKMDERLSLLSKENTFKMAEQPILLNGKSRFKGNALDKVYELTAGSPYFLQKLCSNIVEYMNERRSPYVTGADIDNIAETMVRGELRMQEEEFDGIISSGDKLNAIFTEEELLPLLTRIATSSLQLGWCPISELFDIEKYDAKIDDLVSRDTLEKNEQQVRIKAGLLSRWLRINK